jgi:hypothetical protein
LSVSSCAWRRESGLGRHDRPAHQHRNHAHAALERGRDLEPHEIVRIVEAALAGRILRIEPPRPDQREQHRTGTDRLADRVDEVRTGFDGFDVTPDLIAREGLLQVVGETTRMPTAVVTPIAQEDAGHGDCPRDRMGSSA